MYGTKRGKQHQTKGKQKRELNHPTKEAETKCKKGGKSNKRIEHKINWI